MKEGSIITKARKSYFLCKLFHPFFVPPDYRQVYRQRLEVETEYCATHFSVVIGATKSTEYSKRRIKTAPKKIKVIKQSRLNCKFSRAATRHLLRLKVLPGPFRKCAWY